MPRYNVTGFPIDTILLHSAPGKSLREMVASLFRPLITHKGDIEIPKWDKPSVSFEYQLILGTNFHEEAIVVVDGDEVYFLRRYRDRCWRLYNWMNLLRE